MPNPIAVRPLTRQQLSTFLNGNHLLIKAFENLIQDVNTTIPGNMDELIVLIEKTAIEAGNAIESANSNAGLIQALTNLTAGLALYSSNSAEGLMQIMRSEIEGLKTYPISAQFIQQPDYSTAFLLMGS